MKNFRTNHTGFTLIELTLYIAIFALIISAIAGLAVVSTSQRVKNQVISDVNYQGEAVLSLITYSLHGATSITAPTLGNSGSSLTLVMPNASVNPTVFSSITNSGTNHMQITEGVANVQNYLTNSHVTISNLTFSNVGYTGSDGSIQIKFTLSYLNPSGREEFSYSRNFEGAASVR